MGVVRDRLAHAWSAFLNVDTKSSWDIGTTYGSRPDRLRYNVVNERSIVTSVLTRIAIDVAQYSIRHVRLDDKGRYETDMSSGLNECFTVEPNIDQGPRHLRQDIVATLLNAGTIAIVPVETSLDPSKSTSFDIRQLRVGTIVQWYPRHIRVNLFNQDTGRREDVTLEKKMCAIVENPLYAVMNEPSSTLQRLIMKLNMLDAVDQQSSSGKLDMLIQLPYTIKSDARRQAAEQRRKDIEFQLTGSKYGIAYVDATEKITQLNRPAENNLLTQVEYLTNMLYAQLGVTPEVMDGTADEKTMLNYMNRTVEPILDAIVEAMRRSFLTKTGRSQGQSILYFRDPFKLVPISQLAEIADKLGRNEITSSNEIRQIMGLAPSKDKKADQLRNSNMPEKDLGNGPQNSPELQKEEPVSA